MQKNKQLMDFSPLGFQQENLWLWNGSIFQNTNYFFQVQMLEKAVMSLSEPNIYNTDCSEAAQRRRGVDLTENRRAGGLVQELSRFQDLVQD